MSRKHFRALADALKKTRVGDRDQWEEDCKTIAWVLAQFNPNFDRLRFLGACGLAIEGLASFGGSCAVRSIRRVDVPRAVREERLWGWSEIWLRASRLIFGYTQVENDSTTAAYKDRSEPRARGGFSLKWRKGTNESWKLTVADCWLLHPVCSSSICADSCIEGSAE
jgi:hypothetical protein